MQWPLHRPATFADVREVPRRLAFEVHIKVILFQEDGIGKIAKPVLLYFQESSANEFQTESI